MKVHLLCFAILLLQGCQSNDGTTAEGEPPPQSVDEKIAAAISSIRPRADTSTTGMNWIEGGSFEMGCQACGMPDAQPVHQVKIDGFWIDETPVTNAQFTAFVKATGYKTVAEQPLTKEEFPQLSDDDRQPGSIVFIAPSSKVDLNNPGQWWRFVRGADWQHPEGPGSDIKNKMDHPVVQVCYQDALAYARWAGKRLPTEAEFEYAARGGVQTTFSWGNELKPGGKWAANIFQGEFPHQNTADDGFRGTSPVKAFPANGFGLYDGSGNVWQWCSDWYRADYFEQLKNSGVAVNPTGPEQSYDPDEPGLPKKVQKGGSFLCSDQYCSRYYLGSRGKGEVFSASSNLGFRCAK